MTDIYFIESFISFLFFNSQPLSRNPFTDLRVVL